MAEHDWKPGDVAIRNYAAADGYEMRSMLVIGCPIANHDAGMHWHHVNGGWDPALPARQNLDYRPLLVIDPEDREQVERLRELASDWADRVPYDRDPGDLTYLDAMQQALRAMLAPPKPPKPEEPLGLGAVVEYDGSRWVGMGRNRWLEVPADEPISPRSLHWNDFYADVEILSHGVTS